MAAPAAGPSIYRRKRIGCGAPGAAQAIVSKSNGVTTAALRRQARGNFANDWARNKSIPESDHTCVYRFDSGSKRLEGVQVIVSVGGTDVVVAEFTDFRYNEVFPQSLYTVQLPADVNWMTDPAAKPAPVSLNGPKEATAYFFDALAHENWDSVLQVTWGSRVPPVVKQVYRRPASNLDRRAIPIRLASRILCAVPGAPPEWFDQEFQARRAQR